MKDLQKLDNGLHFSLDADLYSEDVLFKCFYWYGADYDLAIEKDGRIFRIFLHSKSQIGTNHEVLLQKINQDLIDFKLRDIVSKETKNIRDLLTAKAFAHFEMDEGSDAEISDPVGFNPNEL